MKRNIKKVFESVRAEVDVLLQEIKTTKSLATDFAPSNQYTSLAKVGILKSNESSVVINYEYPACLVISQAIHEDFDDAIPVQSLAETIPLAQKVIKSLNKHGITSGTGEFRQQLIKELILNAYNEGINLPGQILALNRNSPRYFELVNSLALVIPELPLPLSNLYALYAHIYSLTYDDGASQKIFLSLQEFAAKVGNELLMLAVQNNSRLPGFVSNVLLGLTQKNRDTAWTELEKLAKGGYELETLNALAIMKIDSVEEVEKIVTHLKDAYSQTEITIPSLIWAYGNIINCNATPEPLRQECVETLKVFGQVQNEQVHFALLSVANNLNVTDEMKIDIISFIDFGNINLIHRIAHIAGKFASANFFIIIRKIVEASKLDFKPEEIHHYLLNNSRENPEGFSQELVAMLTDRIGMIRLGGSRILQVVNSPQTPFHFRIDLLSLPQHHQSRMIKAIVLDFLHPADVIKFIVIFRHTTYPAVLQTLVDALAGIFEDYHHDAIIFLRKELDVNGDVDKELLKIFEKYHVDLAAIITKKNSLEEFNPHKNQARAFYNFLRLSKHKIREQINQDQEKNPIFGAVRTVSIARGKSWKIEKNTGGPSPLQHISTELTYPRMCLMNPDQYNWDFIVNVNSNYKNG